MLMLSYTTRSAEFAGWKQKEPTIHEDALPARARACVYERHLVGIWISAYTQLKYSRINSYGYNKIILLVYLIHKMARTNIYGFNKELQISE